MKITNGDMKHNGDILGYNSHQTWMVLFIILFLFIVTTWDSFCSCVNLVIFFISFSILALTFNCALKKMFPSLKVELTIFLSHRTAISRTLVWGPLLLLLIVHSVQKYLLNSRIPKRILEKYPQCP